VRGAAAGVAGALARRGRAAAVRFTAGLRARLAGWALARAGARTSRLVVAGAGGGASVLPAETGSPARPTSGVVTRLVADARAAASTRPSSPAEIQIRPSRMRGQRVTRAAKNR
jgi:hypothetical protein